MRSKLTYQFQQDIEQPRIEQRFTDLDKIVDLSSEKDWQEDGSCIADAEERQLDFDRDVGGTETQSIRE